MDELTPMESLNRLGNVYYYFAIMQQLTDVLHILLDDEHATKQDAAEHVLQLCRFIMTERLSSGVNF